MSKFGLAFMGIATTLTIQNASAQSTLSEGDACPGDSGGPLYQLDDEGRGPRIESKNFPRDYQRSNCRDVFLPPTLTIPSNRNDANGKSEFVDLNGDGLPEIISTDALTFGLPIKSKGSPACELQDGSSPQWLEVRNVFGDWDRVAVIFGYGNNEDACYDWLAALNHVAPKRLSRCTAIQC